MDLVSSHIFHNISIHSQFNQAIKVINNCVPHHQAIIASLIMMAWGNTSKELSELVWVVIHHLRLDLLPAMEVWALVVPVVMNQLLQSLCLNPYTESLSLLKKVIAILRKKIINLDVDIGVKQRIYD